jgi:hypothetical protein
MDDAQLRARMLAAADLAGREARVPGAPAARRRGRRRQLTLAVTLAATATAVVLAVPVGGRLLDGGPGVAPAGGGAEPTPAPTEAPFQDDPFNPPAPAEPTRTLASGTNGDGLAWRFEGYRTADGRVCLRFQTPGEEHQLAECDTPDGSFRASPSTPGDAAVYIHGPTHDASGRVTSPEQVDGVVQPPAVTVRLMLKGGRTVDLPVIDGDVLGLSVDLFATVLAKGDRYDYARTLDAQGRVIACQGIYERMAQIPECVPGLERADSARP